jgi:AcrR family transcriptional regulator
MITLFLTKPDALTFFDITSAHRRDDICRRNVKMWGMDKSAIPPSKRQRAIEAGARIFLRFGFARATMGDIATAAGMSRPALYLIFCSKEEVFEAVVAHWIEDSLTRIAAGLPTRSNLGEKLRFACETWCVEGLERALANPDVRDMSTLPAVRESYARFEACITDILREPAERSGLGIPASDFARVIVCAMQGFKQTARSGEEMRHLIAVEILAIERALASRPIA